MAVLLVVADESIRAAWFDQLHDARFRVTALGNEDAARLYLQSFTPSVVVYHAQDDGDETRRFLYDVSVRESGPQIPIVVLSSSAATRRLAEGCGCTVIDMPTDDATLCAELTRLAPQSRRPSLR